MKASPKSFHVKSFGCQMNVYDGERMAELLEAEGLTPAADGAEADLVVLNTCHIREKAAEKVYSEIGRVLNRGGDRGRLARRERQGQCTSDSRPERHAAGDGAFASRARSD